MNAETIIRAPNHLGDLMMALPALAAAGVADVQVVRWLSPLLEMVRRGDPQGGGIDRVIPFDRGTRGLLRGANELRLRRYRRGILLTPSFSAALVFLLGRVRERRGTPTDGRSPMLTEPVDLEALGATHRSIGYLTLVAGSVPERAPTPRLPVSERERARWQELVGPIEGPLIGVFPGSNASSRRWEPVRYTELVRRLSRQGLRVLVFGSHAERALTAEVSGGQALDLGGRTDLPLLAAGLAACELLVTNDSGPMHLAAAVGTKTLSLQGPADPAVTRPLGEGHELLWGADLPCVPCVRNRCPRRGEGYRLPTAERECMRLIEVDDVHAAVVRHAGDLLT